MSDQRRLQSTNKAATMVTIIITATSIKAIVIIFETRMWPNAVVDATDQMASFVIIVELFGCLDQLI